LNLHFHIIFLEGVYLDRTDAGLKPRFVKAAPPSNSDISGVLQKIVIASNGHADAESMPGASCPDP
jgi:hypothetical protein